MYNRNITNNIYTLNVTADSPGKNEYDRVNPWRRRIYRPKYHRCDEANKNSETTRFSHKIKKP